MLFQEGAVNFEFGQMPPTEQLPSYHCFPPLFSVPIRQRWIHFAHFLWPLFRFGNSAITNVHLLDAAQIGTLELMLLITPGGGTELSMNSHTHALRRMTAGCTASRSSDTVFLHGLRRQNRRHPCDRCSEAFRHDPLLLTACVL